MKKGHELESMQRAAMRFAFMLAASLLFTNVIRAQTNRDIDRCSVETSPDLAIQSCTRAIASRKLSTVDLAYAFNIRGIVYSHKGDDDRAIQDYSQAIRLVPDYAEALYNRGISYSHKGEYDRAIQDYDQAIRLKPAADTFYSRGYAYQNKGEHDRAIHDYNQAIQLKPDYLDAFYNRGIIYRGKGEYDRAIQDYDQAIRLKPAAADSFSSRGLAFFAKGEYDRAVRDYNQAIRLDPQYAFAFRARGIVYFEEGQFGAAVTDFTTGMKLAPSDLYQLIWLHLAQAHAGQKAPEALSDGRQIDMNIWPGPILSMYQGKVTLKTVLGAAADDPDGKKQNDQLCDMHFYVGQYDLLHELRSDAVKEFQATGHTCPMNYVEYAAAQAELKRLGQAVAAPPAASGINNRGEDATTAPAADRANGSPVGAVQAPSVVVPDRHKRLADPSQPSSTTSAAGIAETPTPKNSSTRPLSPGMLDGVYVGLRKQAGGDLFGYWTTTSGFDYNFLIFGPNGVVSGNFPREGMDGLNLAGVVRNAPAWEHPGQYRVSGNRVEIEWQNPVAADHWSITFDDSAADPRFGVYIPICRCNGARFSGTYQHGRYALKFLPDGKFLDSGAVDSLLTGGAGYPRPGRGTYRIQNFTLYLSYDDGRQFRKSFAAPAVEEGQPSFDWIEIGTSMLYEQDYYQRMRNQNPLPSLPSYKR